MSFFKRSAEPVMHSVFGRLEWQRGRRSAGSWVGRVYFPPSDNEIDISIPGGRKGPEDVEPLYQALCNSLPSLAEDLEALVQQASAESGFKKSTLLLQGLYFFDTSLEHGEWKLVYLMEGQEIHVDGLGLALQTAMVLES